MGTVYRASAEEAGAAGPAGTVVAIKVFHDHLVGDEMAFKRFEREAEVGRNIRHPHVVRTYDAGREEVGGRAVHYIVMELVEGRTLEDLLKELGTVPEHLLAQIADQALSALEAVHAGGVVHRDIKPQNLVITPDHRVLLMDLGVARIEGRGHTLTQSGEFVGSLAYAAPEQFVPEEDGVGPRADLYAFGVVLYELATGRSPFDFRDLATLVQQKLQRGVPPPRASRAEVDAFWDAVILTATRKAPSERFASAAEMRRILQEGEASDWWRKRAAQVARPVAERALKRLRLDREAPLVGRAGAVDGLSRTWDRARRGGGVLLLGGPSGVGKSRLLYEFLERVAAAGGPTIAAGRCVGAGGRSYQPFVEALGDLLVPAEAKPGERRPSLEGRLAPLLADTPGVVPHLVDFLLGGVQPGVDGAFSKDALHGACARVLQRIASEQPMILAVEDLHLAGEESVELFRYVARNVSDHPLLLVGVYSTDEVDEGTPVHALVTARDAAERVGLGPLDDAGTEDLVRAVAHTERTVRALARPLHERCDGNASLVLEMLAQLRSDGVLVPKGEGLELSRPLDALAVPTTNRDLVQMRLHRLDDDQRSTLEVAAVLGWEFDPALLSAVLEQNRIQLLQRLAALERKHRLVAGAGKSALRFASRSIYETVYEGINSALRAEYHALVADTIQKRLPAGAAPDGPTAYALLRHLLHAGRATEAEPWLETALDHIAASFHASWSAPFVERVREAFADAPAPKRLAIALKLWTFYELLASRPDQLRVLEEATALADGLGDPALRARVHALRAGSDWYAGDYQRAEAEARLGLELARAGGDRKWEATCHHTLGAVAYRRGDLERAAAEFRDALRVRREVGDRRGEASSLQSLGLVMQDTGEEAQSLPTMEEALRIWHEVGERRGEAAVRMNIGAHLVDLARYEEGLRYLEQSIAGHRETGALLSEATALANLGNAHEILGRIDDATDAWGRALELFVDLGNPNGELAVRTMLGAALGAYGRHEEALKHLLAAVDLATRLEARPKRARAHRELGRLLHDMGRRPEGWMHLEKALALEDPKSVASRVDTLAALGEAALVEGDPERATRYLSEAVAGARGAGGGTAALVLCRLARAHRDAGRAAEAAAFAREALERVETAERLSPARAPEIYATLGEVLEDGRRQEFLTKAKAVVEERARHIADEASREHFLTRQWPNTRVGPIARS
jgi:tetratricopeptide (TPR) repeat protein